jgi:hypothetical protein
MNKDIKDVDDDIADLLNDHMEKNNIVLNEEMKQIMRMLEEDDDNVTVDDCFRLYSYCMGVPEDKVRCAYRNIKEGSIK